MLNHRESTDTSPTRLNSLTSESDRASLYTQSALHHVQTDNGLAEGQCYIVFLHPEIVHYDC